MTDFYSVLGVAKDASAEQIKQAYRKLAKQYHPDATGGDKAAEQKFIEVNEAYDTLSDAEKRRAYDEAREARARPGPTIRYQQHTFDADALGDILGGIFGNMRGRQSLDVLTRRDIAPWDAALGSRIDVRSMDKTLSVKIPPGAKSGQRLRLRGQGLSDGRGNAGDLIIELTIQNPAKLSAEMKNLYEKIRESA